MTVCALILAAALPNAEPPGIEVALTPSPGRLTVQLEVQGEIPSEWSRGLVGGAPVSITYRLRLFRNRRWLWDQRLSGHELVVEAQRDPLTGVFTLIARQDGEVLASGHAATVEEAIHWVTHPPPAAIPVPLRHDPLWLVVRAEYLTKYKLLVIPSTVGTEWVTRAVPESP